MKKKKYFYILLSLLYYELIFHLFLYDSYLRSSIINIILFCIVNSFIVYLFTSVWSEKINKILSYITYSVLAIWYSLHYIFAELLESPFSLSLFALSDQAAQNSKNVIIGILENIHILLLLFVPLIVYIIFRKKIFCKRIVKKEICKKRKYRNNKGYFNYFHTAEHCRKCIGKSKKRVGKTDDLYVTLR